MDKIQEFLDKIGIEDKIVDFDKNNEPIKPSYIIEEWNKAINYTRCCMGEAEQLSYVKEDNLGQCLTCGDTDCCDDFCNG